MKGFAVTAMILIGLDVLLTAPASRVTALFVLPTQWLAEWMDPGRPLIRPRLASTTSSASPASSPGSILANGELIAGLTNPLTAPLAAGVAAARGRL